MNKSIEMNHSPLPWTLNHPSLYSIVDSDGNALLQQGWLKEERRDKANAALIVKAVNNHEKLVEALEELYFRAIQGLDQSATHDGLKNCEALTKAREALEEVDK